MQQLASHHLCNTNRPIFIHKPSTKGGSDTEDNSIRRHLFDARDNANASLVRGNDAEGNAAPESKLLRAFKLSELIKPTLNLSNHNGWV